MKQFSVSVNGRVATLFMKNGQNQLDLEFLENMHKALDEVLCSEAEVLITTGEGPKFFSTGVDLAKVMADGYEASRSFWKNLAKLLARIMTFPIPTVAAINGHAIAGGAFLALAHDYRVMQEERGWFWLNEIHMPARFPRFLRELVMIKVPPGNVIRDLMVYGNRYTARDAESVKLIDKSCPLADLTKTATDLGIKTLKLGSITRHGLHDMKCDIYNQALQYVDHNEDDFVKSFKSKL